MQIRDERTSRCAATSSETLQACIRKARKPSTSEHADIRQVSRGQSLYLYRHGGLCSLYIVGTCVQGVGEKRRPWDTLFVQVHELTVTSSGDLPNAVRLLGGYLT